MKGKSAVHFGGKLPINTTKGNLAVRQSENFKIFLPICRPSYFKNFDQASILKKGIPRVLSDQIALRIYTRSPIENGHYIITFSILKHCCQIIYQEVLLISTQTQLKVNTKNELKLIKFCSPATPSED